MSHSSPNNNHPHALSPEERKTWEHLPGEMHEKILRHSPPALLGKWASLSKDIRASVESDPRLVELDHERFTKALRHDQPYVANRLYKTHGHHLSRPGLGGIAVHSPNPGVGHFIRNKFDASPLYDNSWTFAHEAVFNPHELKHLLTYDAGLANVSHGSTDMLPIHVAVKYDIPASVHHILDHHPQHLHHQDINPYGYSIADSSLLHMAAKHGSAKAAHVLITRGLDPNIRDVHLRTPLHVAADYGHPHVVRVLLEHGAHPRVEDHLGHTPLHYAITHGHHDVSLIIHNHTR